MGQSPIGTFYGTLELSEVLYERQPKRFGLIVPRDAECHRLSHSHFTVCNVSYEERGVASFEGQFDEITDFQTAVGLQPDNTIIRCTRLHFRKGGVGKDIENDARRTRLEGRIFRLLPQRRIYGIIFRLCSSTVLDTLPEVSGFADLVCQLELSEYQLSLVLLRTGHQGRGRSLIQGVVLGRIGPVSVRMTPCMKHLRSHKSSRMPGRDVWTMFRWSNEVTSPWSCDSFTNLANTFLYCDQDRADVIRGIPAPVYLWSVSTIDNECTPSSTPSNHRGNHRRL